MHFQALSAAVTVGSKIESSTVKDILRMPSAMVFTSGFNRPNLHYSVRMKPENSEENLEMLFNLVQGEFSGCSGIIYTTTVKEVDTLYSELK